MSNIYIQEPPTSGKVLLLTSVGEIEIELWSKEAPKACRNFIQLCMEGYYDGTLFHRVVKGFIAQGGDPSGTGEGGESIYGEPFKDEIHTRLRFNRRGLVAMANSGKDDNESQFFFTLGPTPELQGKHTIFGKVAGETIYNMIKLEDGEVGENDRPLHCHKITKTEILSNPFNDILPRVLKQKGKTQKKKKEQKQGVKNFKLLSFGEEAEEDEEEAAVVSKTFTSKNKSSHDLLKDPKLSAVPAVSKENEHEWKSLTSSPKDEEENKSVDGDAAGKDEYYLGKERDEELLQKRAQIQKEIEQLKDDYKNRNKKPYDSNKGCPEGKIGKESSKEGKNEILDEYKANLVKYGKMQENIPQKGTSREQFTLQLLAKFKGKLKAAKKKEEKNTEGDTQANSDEEDSWMRHSLKFEETAVLARDASTKGDDWFDITDPRHGINKRRREAHKAEMEKIVKKLKD